MPAGTKCCELIAQRVDVYAKISRDAGVTDENLAVMEREVAELEPQLRVFSSGTAFTDPDLMQSFRRTLKLAQTTASSINVTFQGIGPHAFPDAMPAFAEVLRSALVDDGIDRLGWVTIRNEPNVPAMPHDFYRNLYVQLDGELTRLASGHGSGSWAATSGSRTKRTG